MFSPDSTNPTTILVATWTAPDDTGRPPTSSLRRAVPQGIGSSWRNGPQDVQTTTTTATITVLNENALYQVHGSGNQRRRERPYSQPGAGWTGTGNPNNNNPAFETGASTTREFPENTPPNRPIGNPVMATGSGYRRHADLQLHGTRRGGVQYRLRNRTAQDQFRRDLRLRDERHLHRDGEGDRFEQRHCQHQRNHQCHRRGRRRYGTLDRRPPRSSSDDEGPSIGDAKPTFPDAATTRSLKENTEPDLNIARQ